jgi:CRISPR/Cas system CMR subunit Cmr6 (Cas7 group RAMP superfamily)
LVYGTALYSSSEEIRKKFTEDSLKIINAKKRRLTDSLKMSNEKKDTTIAENKKKRKNGLKNFFDKIFKKKSEKPLPPAK